MKVELTKYRVKEGKSELVDEWIDYMHNDMDDVLMNLEGEKMFVETIFREAFNDVEYLYWYSVQEEASDIQISESDLDKKHIEYWEQCIDKTFRPEDMKAEIVMIPERIREAMHYDKNK
ncbi:MULTISPECIES: DUF6176 family protein [Jeotgalicoccus]|uniref:DUF6176 family protein n=1 Tax=Jeotgalicoccus TaxID=227979 RepID=UPI000427540C|nr:MULTISPECIES: DUF6176 family protein [Jeotgalicoccus]